MPKSYEELFRLALVSTDIKGTNRMPLIKDIRCRLQDYNLKDASKIVYRAIYELRVRRAMEILEKNERFPDGVKAIRDEFSSFMKDIDTGDAFVWAKIAKNRLEKKFQ